MFGSHLWQVANERKREECFAHFFSDFGENWRSFLGRDLSSQHRDEWERVTLKAGEKLTSAEWRSYQVAFELALGRVEDATESEVGRRILSVLPGKWRERVEEENDRRQHGTFWVRFPKPLSSSVEEIKNIVVTVLKQQYVPIFERSTEILVDCGSEEGRETVLAMNGWGDQGMKFRVANAEKRI